MRFFSFNRAQIRAHWQRLNELKSFKDVLSPASWLLITCYVPVYIVLLGLSLEEFFIFFVVDAVSGIFIGRLEQYWFFKKYPDSKFYFPTLLEDRAGNFSSQEKQAFFDSLLKFPKRRALWCFWVTYPKLIPVALCIWWFSAPGEGVWQLAKLYLINSVAQIYFVSAIFMESHGLISRTVAQLHKKFDWSDVFSNFKIPGTRDQWVRFENLAIVAIWLTVLILNGMTVAEYHQSELGWLMAQIFFAGAVALVFISRIWTMSRQYLMGGLEELFKYFDEIDVSKRQDLLPLYSSTDLARFGQIVNSLLLRVRRNEEEISAWVFRQAERSRFQALGEISGLVVHDLASPLHVVRFCADELHRNKKMREKDQYYENMVSAVDRASDLIGSLRTYLRDPGSDELQADFMNAHRHVLRILHTQYAESGGRFQRVRMEMSPELESTLLGIPMPNLLHILINLYSNCVDDFIRNAHPSPMIRVWPSKLTEDRVEISIQDNGSGLSPEAFESMTSSMLLKRDPSVKKGSLGMKLVRRLIESRGGTLVVRKPEQSQYGTLFVFEVPRASELLKPARNK